MASPLRSSFLVSVFASALSAWAAFSDPNQIQTEAYIHLVQGDQSLDSGRLDEALDHYTQSRDFYAQLAADFPAFQSRIVAYRSSYCAGQIDLVMLRLGESIPPAEPVPATLPFSAEDAPVPVLISAPEFSPKKNDANSSPKKKSSRKSKKNTDEPVAETPAPDSPAPASEPEAPAPEPAPEFADLILFPAVPPVVETPVEPDTPIIPLLDDFDDLLADVPDEPAAAPEPVSVEVISLDALVDRLDDDPSPEFAPDADESDSALTDIQPAQPVAEEVAVLKTPEAPAPEASADGTPSEALPDALESTALLADSLDELPAQTTPDSEAPAPEPIPEPVEIADAPENDEEVPSLASDDSPAPEIPALEIAENAEIPAESAELAALPEETPAPPQEKSAKKKSSRKKTAKSDESAPEIPAPEDSAALESLRAEVSAVSSDRDALQSHVDELSAEVAAVSSDRDALLSRVDELSADNESLRAASASAEEQILSLTGEIDTLRSASRTAEELQSQIQSLTADNDDLRARQDNLSDDLRDVTAQRDSLLKAEAERTLAAQNLQASIEAQKAEAEAEISRLSSQLTDLSVQLDAAKGQLSSSEHRCSLLESEASDARASAQSQAREVLALQNDNQRLSRDIESRDAEKASIAAALDSANARLAEAQARAAQAESALKVFLDERDAERARALAERSAAMDWNETLDSIRARIAANDCAPLIDFIRDLPPPPESYALPLALLHATALVRLHQGPEAVGILAPLADGNSRDPDFQAVYGTALLSAERFPEARSALERAISLSDEAAPEIYANLALLCAFSSPKDLEAARKFYRKALAHGLAPIPALESFLP